MPTLPGLKKGITKDVTPPATDTQVSPITIPDGTTVLTTKLHNEIVDNEDQLIDYISGDNATNLIPQNAIDTLESDLANKQPINSKLTEISGLTFVDDDIIQQKSGALVNRTPVQFKTDLVLVKDDVGLGNVDNTSDANKPVSTAQQTALDGKEDSLGFTPEDIANKNAVNGYAGLDASSKLTGSQQVYGSVANTATQGDDSRLSDDRTPLAHATNHKTLGSDEIKLDELGIPNDNTTLDATTILHGLLSKDDKSKIDNNNVGKTFLKIMTINDDTITNGFR